MYLHTSIAQKTTHLADIYIYIYFFFFDLLLHWIWAEIPSLSQVLIRLSLRGLKWILVVLNQKVTFMSCCFVFDWNWSTPEFSWLLLGILIYYYHAHYMYEDSKLLLSQHIAEWGNILNINCHWFWLKRMQIFNHSTVWGAKMNSSQRSKWWRYSQQSLYFAEPVKTSLWAVWARATCTVHLISVLDQPGMKRMYHCIREAKSLLS